MRGSHGTPIPIRIEAVELYNETLLSNREVGLKYGVSSWTIYQWRGQYEDNKLTFENSIAISHSTSSVERGSTSKAQTITINGVVWVEYKKPLEVMNINGVDYMKEGM